MSFYLWEFLFLQIFCDIWVEILGVSLIKTVDFSFLLDLHIAVHQNKLPYGLVMKDKRERKTKARLLKKIYTVNTKDNNL